MKLIIKAIFFLTIVLKLSTPSYSLYDIYGDISFLYDIKFTGKVIVSSKFFNYTNTNAQFDFNYSLSTRSELAEGEQIVVDWKFSPIRTTSLPSLFVDLWNSYIEEQTKDIVYTIKLPTDQFLVFDKRGKKNSLGYFFEILFPIIDTKKNQYNQKYTLDIPNELRTDHLSLEISGWDFFKITRPLDAAPLILLETNTQFINDIYSDYAERQSKKIPTVFWMQHINIFQINEYKQVQNEAILTGMYFLEVDKKILSKAIILSKLSVEVPFQYQNFKVPFNVQLEGKFDISLRDEIEESIENLQKYRSNTQVDIENNDRDIN